MNKFSVTSILAMDDSQIARMGESELKKAIRSFQKSISQRINRLKKEGLSGGQAEIAIRKAGTPQTTRNGKPLNINQLRNELFKGIRQIKLNTLTIKGMKEAQKKIFGENWKDWTPEQQKKMWDAYNRYIEKYPEALTVGDEASERIQREIQNVVLEHEDMSVDEILDYFETMNEDDDEEETGWENIYPI